MITALISWLILVVIVCLLYWVLQQFVIALIYLLLLPLAHVSPIR
jgi:hypothetical protein